MVAQIPGQGTLSPRHGLRMAAAPTRALGCWSTQTTRGTNHCHPPIQISVTLLTIHTTATILTIQHARLGGATCYVHSGGTWPSELTSMAIDVPVGTMGTLQVNSKTIVQGLSNTTTDPTSRTLLAYRFQVGASSGAAGGTGTGALALRHVSATACPQTAARN